MNKSSTLPLPHRLGLERASSSAARDREGYYSDRNDLIREREREREKERERGYLSDHNSRY
jgi:T-lymphoma invasion and metastasis-inducing protein 1